MLCRNIAAKDELTVDLPFDNLFQMFHTSVKKLPDGPCLGHRIDDRYAWQTYKVSRPLKKLFKVHPDTAVGD